MINKQERGGRRLVKWIAIVSTAAVALLGAWVLANSIDSDLRPWAPGLEPAAEERADGAHHEGWLALVGLQDGHLGDPLTQGRKSWAAWDVARQRLLALDDVTLVPSVPPAVNLGSDSPLSCRPLPQCSEVLRQGLPKLPEALKVAAPLVDACAGVGRRTGFDEPLVRVPAALSRPGPGAALSTCGRLWMAQLVLAHQQGNAADALEAWSTLHRVSSGVFTGSQSLVSGVIAATWLQTAHAEATALAAAFPMLHPQVQAALATSVPWRDVSRRWWIDEAWVQDRLIYEALDVGVAIQCVAQGQGVERCQSTRPGRLPAKARPVLPNLTRSEFREQHAAVVAATQMDDPVMALQRLKEQAQRQRGDVFSGLHFRNTLGSILLSVSTLEASVERYMPQGMDAESTRQAAVLSLSAQSRYRAGAQFSEADVIRAGEGSALLKGQLQCEDGCRRLVVRSWRTDQNAPRWHLQASP